MCILCSQGMQLKYRQIKCAPLIYIKMPLKLICMLLYYKLITTLYKKKISFSSFFGLKYLFIFLINEKHFLQKCLFELKFTLYIIVIVQAFSFLV